VPDDARGLDDQDPHHVKPADPAPDVRQELPGQEPFEWFGSAERAASREAAGAAL
jgi:hypothetical protein